MPTFSIGGREVWVTPIIPKCKWCGRAEGYVLGQLEMICLSCGTEYAAVEMAFDVKEAAIA